MLPVRVRPVLGVLVLAGLAVPVAGTPAQAAATCLGEPATHVGSPGRTVNGTAGDDVIVSNGAHTVNAGGGDDLVCATGRPSAPSVSTDLGPGADRYHGWALTDDVTDADADVDVIATGGGRDLVTVGTPGAPLVDRVDLGGEPALARTPIRYDDVMSGTDPVTFGSVRVLGDSMAVGSSLRARGGPARLDLSAAPAGTWRVDNGVGTASEAGTERFRFTGFTAFDTPDGEVTFQGSPADEYVRVGTLGGGVLHARMWGGDDIAVVTRGGAATVEGGAGTDHLVALAFADQFEREEDPDAGVASLGLPHQAGRLHGEVFRYSGFERYVVHATRRAVVRGTPGPDVVSGSSCDLDVRTGDGADRLRAFWSTWASYDPDWHCDEDTFLDGGAGADSLVDEVPAAVVRGGDGHDAISAPPTSAQAFTAYGDRGHDVIRGSGKVESPPVSAGTDVLHGGPGDDYLDGEGGDDRLYGDGDDDRLYGDSGDDTAYGGDGADLCRAERRAGCER